MDEEILIPIPPGLDDDDEEVNLLAYLQGHSEALSPAFDLKVDDGDCRTSYMDHEITDILLTDDGVQIEYEVLTHTYYGYQDIDSDGTVSRSLAGVSNGTHWVFKPSLSLDPRSTFEEF